MLRNRAAYILCVLCSCQQETQWVSIFSVGSPDGRYTACVVDRVAADGQALALAKKKARLIVSDQNGQCDSPEFELYYAGVVKRIKRVVWSPQSDQVAIEIEWEEPTVVVHVYNIRAKQWKTYTPYESIPSWAKPIPNH